jgi:voltage-gated potassium channel
VIVLGALITLVFEVRDPASDIRSFGDSVWWAVVTVVTVGYGDFVPVTVPGRVSAVAMMVAGTAVVSILTAAVASFFVGQGGKRRNLSLGDVVDSVQALQAEVKELRTALAQTSGVPPTPPRPADTSVATGDGTIDPADKG